MVLYLIIIFFLILGSFIREAKAKGGYFFIACLFLVVVSCFRGSTVGIDHSEYIYRALGKGFTEEERANIEIVWGGLNSIFKELQSGELFTFVTSLLSLIPLFLFIKKESTYRILSLLLFIIIPYGFCFFQTGIRQSMATAFIIWAYYFLIQKEYLFTAVFTLLAVGIHASAFFVLPFFLLGSLNLRNTIFYIVLIISALFGFVFKYNIFDLFERISPYVQFLSYYEYYGNYHADDVLNINGLISVIVPPTIFSLVSLRYGKTNDYYTKLFCWGVVGTNVFASVPMIGRYFMYFTILQVILLPNVFRRCPIIIRYGLILTIAYMLLYFFMFVPVATGTDHYQTFFH